MTNLRSKSPTMGSQAPVANQSHISNHLNMAPAPNRPMTRPARTPYLLLTLLVTLLGIAKPATAFEPETSLVEIEVTKKTYDYITPWVTRSQQTRKNGILVGPQQILTTADGLSGQYLSRIKKGGVSHPYTATLKWVDYYANVAIFDVADPEFWQDMQPVDLAEAVPQSGDLQIYRWRSGRIEERAAEIIQLYSGTSKMSYLQHLKLAVSSDIDAAGWSEVVFDGDQLIGLTASAVKDTLTILPAPFIAGVIERRTLEDDPGLGYFDFKYMPAKNPALLQSKGLDQRDVGVVVTEVGGKRLSRNTLKVGDILLAIDGFEIDSEGKYVDPHYGRLSMNGLATRAHPAGAGIPIRLWRDGAEQTVDYVLPRADFDKSLIPEERYDAPPQYLIAGGLVFQPLNGPLMKALGPNKPILLDYYNSRPPLDNRQGLVLLSGVLPDDYNRGYENLHYVLIDQINGQTIHSLKDIEAALEKPVDGFHRIDFMHDEAVQHIVLDAEAMPLATVRILTHYNIPSASAL